MHAVGEARSGLTVTGTILLAAASGALLAQASERGLLFLGTLAFVALALVTFEAPIVTFAGLALLLAIAPEAGRDVLGVTGVVWGPVLPEISLPIVILCLLALVLALTSDPSDRVWPGVPATVAAGLLLISLANVALFGGPIVDGLLVVRPLAVLVVALLVGYWIAIRYGMEIPLKALVAAGMLAIPLGFYSAAAGDLSFYDSSYVYLIGTGAVLVLFRAVDIGFARIPFAVLSLLVIVLSLRRGAMLAVAITLLITGVVSGRIGFRTTTALVAGSVIAAELFFPGVVTSRVEGVVHYFSGASGQDFSVNYRHYETANALTNVEHHKLWGIGPTADWTLYRTFDGKFVPQDSSYLHNSYLWVWLRYGLLGLVLYLAFVASSALVLIRRSGPVAAVTIGASMVGLAVALATASFLTTTIRWPLTVGLFVGIGLAAYRRRAPQEAGGWQLEDVPEEAYEYSFSR